MSRPGPKTQTYTAWIKIDCNLPWIELTETFGSKSQAQVSAKEKLSGAEIKIVKLPK